MLTKTLKFDDDVLSILRDMTWTDDGLLGTLPPNKLERKLYEKVNTALSLLGGKWNRKLGGHVFPVDPRDRVDGLVGAGEITVEKDGFFQTPLAVVERMLELVQPVGIVLEPSAGLGAIADNIPTDGKNIFCVEKNEQRAAILSQKGYGEVKCVDFLEYNPIFRFNTIYANYPFEELQDIRHVRHSYDLLETNGSLVAVMGEGPFFRNDKIAVEFRSWFASVGGCSEKLPPNSFKESGTGVNARLVVIKKGGENDA